MLSLFDAGDGHDRPTTVATGFDIDTGNRAPALDQTGTAEDGRLKRPVHHVRHTIVV